MRKATTTEATNEPAAGRPFAVVTEVLQERLRQIQAGEPEIEAAHGVTSVDPQHRRRDLIRAAALIVAEVERLDRDAVTPAAASNRKVRAG